MKRDWTKATEMILREAVMFRGFDQSIMKLFGQQPQQQSKEAPQPKQKPQQKSLSDLLGIPTDARRT
ncbi:MAG: hypothetical protein E6Q97_03135 [Desulfurellales bacterium]|nr:MAG: hypothetical protein E6Q97_03135 [Desulfurellales bacterium]